MIDLIYQLVKVAGRLKRTQEHLKTQEMCNEPVQMEPCSLAFVPDHFKMQEMCNRAVRMEPLSLKHVSDHLKTKEMCEESIEERLQGLYFAPDYLKTQGMCEKAITFNPYMLRFVTDRFKTQEKSNAAVMKDPCTLEFVPDPFNTVVIKNARPKNKKEELMSVIWHLPKWWDWCAPEDEKKDFYGPKQVTDIFTINVNKVVVSDKMPCNNGKDCRYIAGYQVDGALIPVFIKTPKNIFSYGVSQYHKNSAYSVSFNVSEKKVWMAQHEKIWNEVKSQLFKKLVTEPIKGEGKYIHGKLKTWKERIKTNFHG